MSRNKIAALALTLLLALPLAAPLASSPRVETDKGVVEGALSTDAQVQSFKGIPYAAAPVGKLRWKAPQPAAPWKKTLKATEFGPRAMQGVMTGWGMVFRDDGPKEDCLYLNVWTPAAGHARLPVMVWIYGGGFAAGGTSEPRQDGEALAKKGVVVVSMNYRLGVFGFMAHPELSKESGHGSGNYGLQDQLAALQWVQKNIAAFGGDPGKVTIFGESAGSFSVSALIASPLAKGLFQQAIGESGALFGANRTSKTLIKAEEDGLKFAESVGAHSLEALRAKPADKLLKAALKPDAFRFSSNVDGYFLPATVADIYAQGKQSPVTLLAGWNADEGGYQGFFRDASPTAENFVKKAGEIFGDKAGAFLKLYAFGSDEEAKRSAQDLAGDQFIAFSTWKWMETHAATSSAKIYRYQFDQGTPLGPNAYHSAEIEFVFGTLASKGYAWTPQDMKLSALMMDYWSNFAKTGDPNGVDLPKWPRYWAKGKYKVMHLSSDPHVADDIHRKRYLFLDGLKDWPK